MKCMKYPLLDFAFQRISLSKSGVAVWHILPHHWRLAWLVGKLRLKHEVAPHNMARFGPDMAQNVPPVIEKQSCMLGARLGAEVFSRPFSQHERICNGPYSPPVGCQAWVQQPVDGIGPRQTGSRCSLLSAVWVASQKCFVSLSVTLIPLQPFVRCPACLGT